MAKLIYSGITSLDGYVADKAGKFDWSVPDSEVHTAINDLTRSVGTFLLGRRMNQVLVAGHGGRRSADRDQGFRADLAGGRQGRVRYAGYRVQRQDADRRIFHPDEVRRMKATAEGDISVGGPNLAAHAIKAGLVDEYHLFVNPVLVGGGTVSRTFPDDTRIGLELLDERRFRNGVVLLRYAPRT